MTTRKKKVLIGTIDRPGAEEAFAKYAKATARSNQINAIMDVAITKIRERYQPELTDLSEVKENSFEKLLKYSEDHRDEFGKKKSMEFTHGVIGFRTGTPKLKTKKGFTWASALNLIKEFMPDYVRTKEEPNKDAILMNRNEPEVEQVLDKVGLYVDQEESFFVDPKKELIEV